MALGQSLSSLADTTPTEHGLTKKNAINLLLISRKSTLNPGTRYSARGLNSVCGVGNEMECDVISWITLSNDVCSADDDVISSHTRSGGHLML